MKAADRLALFLLVVVVAGSGPEWGEVRPIPGFPAKRLVRAPSVTSHHDTAIIAADAVPLGQGDSLPRRLLTLVRDPGGPIEPPPGAFQFAHPKVVVDPEGQLHLFWAEFETPATDLTRLLRQPQVLWHAAWAKGHWSAPEVVLRAKTIGWGDANGAIAADSEGGIHVAAPAAPDGGVNHLVYLRLRGDRWSRRDFPNYVTYAATVTLPKRSVIIAFVGTDSGALRYSKAVLSVRSNDNGGSWLPPRLVLAANRYDPGDPRLLSDGETADLFWATRSGFEIKELYVAQLERPSGDWLVNPIVPVPSGALLFDVARQACGEIVALVQTLRENPRSLGLQESSLRVGRAAGEWHDVSIGLDGGREIALFTSGGGLSLVVSGVRRSDSALVTGRTTRSGCTS